MTRLESLIRIRESALLLTEALAGNHACEVLSAKEQLFPLVEEFYRENREFLSPRQYEEARKNPAYFLALVETAIEQAKNDR